jgi:hypothetical protein
MAFDRSVAPGAIGNFHYVGHNPNSRSALRAVGSTMEASASVQRRRACGAVERRRPLTTGIETKTWQPAPAPLDQPAASRARGEAVRRGPVTGERWHVEHWCGAT